MWPVGPSLGHLGEFMGHDLEDMLGICWGYVGDMLGIFGMSNDINNREILATTMDHDGPCAWSLLAAWRVAQTRLCLGVSRWSLANQGVTWSPQKK